MSPSSVMTTTLRSPSDGMVTFTVVLSPFEALITLFNIVTPPRWLTSDLSLNDQRSSDVINFFPAVSSESELVMLLVSLSAYSGYSVPLYVPLEEVPLYTGTWGIITELPEESMTPNRNF